MRTVAVYEHKYVLYEKYGPGKHPCHWCGTTLKWARGNRSGVILADHLDGDVRNNAPDNLVVSCNGCNTIRGRDGFRSAIKDDELVVWNSAGQRTRAVQLTCQECGATFLAEIRRADTAKVCSRRCAGAMGKRSRWGSPS
jgi:hypothetical protein